MPASSAGPLVYRIKIPEDVYSNRSEPVVASNLIGIGLYTPTEASHLLGISAAKIVRRLKGHRIGGRSYAPLWRPQVDIGDERIYLGFRDLMEMRVANAFIERGLSPQKVRRAIEIARDIIGEERPLSTAKFRTDGITVFLQLTKDDPAHIEMIDLFIRQHVFRDIIEPSLKNVDFTDGIPSRWWPRGKQARIVVDPQRAFGQPIEIDTGVPAAALAAAVNAEGSMEAAARIWSVPVAAIRHSVQFQKGLERRLAA
jgi:uncharacterized protein (DUF433 family)